MFGCSNDGSSEYQKHMFWLSFKNFFFGKQRADVLYIGPIFIFFLMFFNKTIDALFILLSM